MKVKPLKGQCMVEMLPADDKDGSIYLPDCAQGKPVYARVVEIGPWPTNPQGCAFVPHFRRGDKVIVGAYTGTQLNRNIGEKYKMVFQDQVLAVVG